MPAGEEMAAAVALHGVSDVAAAGVGAEGDDSVCVCG
jgi:hypothetical protein